MFVHGKRETWYVLKRQEKVGTGSTGKCDSASAGEENHGDLSQMKNKD